MTKINFTNLEISKLLIKHFKNEIIKGEREILLTVNENQINLEEARYIVNNDNLIVLQDDGKIYESINLISGLRVPKPYKNKYTLVLGRESLKYLKGFIDDFLNFETAYKNNVMNLDLILATLVADIDIFLLKQEDHRTDKQRTFTVDEVRQQLFSSLKKMQGVCVKFKIDTKKNLVDYVDL